MYKNKMSKINEKISKDVVQCCVYTVLHYNTITLLKRSPLRDIINLLFLCVWLEARVVLIEDPGSLRSEPPCASPVASLWTWYLFRMQH